jgi:hypothetical protein
MLGQDQVATPVGPPTPPWLQQLNAGTTQRPRPSCDRLPISPGAIPVRSRPVVAVVIRPRVVRARAVIVRRPRIDRRWNIAGRRRIIDLRTSIDLRTVSRQACRNHVAILAFPGSLAPLAAATGDVDAAAGGNLGDDAVGRSRSLPEIDIAVDGREPAAGRWRRSRWGCLRRRSGWRCGRSGRRRRCSRCGRSRRCGGGWRWGQWHRWSQWRRNGRRGRLRRGRWLRLRGGLRFRQRGCKREQCRADCDRC